MILHSQARVDRTGRGGKGGSCLDGMAPRDGAEELSLAACGPVAERQTCWPGVAA
jgi:hypothetical protein